MSNLFTLGRKIFLFMIGFLVLLNFLAWKGVFYLAGPNYLKVDVLDIGQGDSIFIETPNQRHILIDGGPDSAVLEKLAKLLPFWDKSLDVVILTHPDADHVIGLLHVMQKYKVDYILWTGIVRDGPNYQKWIQLIEQKQQQGSKIIITDLNTKIKSGSVLINILNPFDNLQGEYFNKITNDTGIVSHLFFGEKSFLFTADISSKVERLMIDNKINLTSDVLKVSHHGSKYSSSEEFLQAVNPKVAVISVGEDNSYGHPTLEVLQRLRKFGIRTLRTDEYGDIEIISDGENIKVSE